MRNPKLLRATLWAGLAMAAGGVVWMFLPPEGTDTDYDPWVKRPGYRRRHPLVMFDEAHGNTHTARGDYAPLARLLIRDGYRVARGRQRLSPELLETVDVLVVAGPREGFASAESRALVSWMEEGGGLLLAPDGSGSGDAAGVLAGVFGIRFGPAMLRAEPHPVRGLHPIVTGRDEVDLPVESVQLVVGPAVAGEGVAVIAQRAVVREVGRGRMVALSGAGMLAARLERGVKLGLNTPGAANQQFALNLLHWLSRLT